VCGAIGKFSEERGRQVGYVDLVGLGHHGGVADGVLQFAHIAGPGMALEDEARSRRDAADAFAVLLREFRDEMLDEERQIFFVLGEGGHGDLDHGEAVVEVFAEEAIGDGLAEIAVGGGDDAYVDLACLQRADALDFLVLEGAEELGLCGGGHIADFVEEEGAFVGGFEEAWFIAVGAGEGATNVPEEFALKEGFNDGGAVEDDVLALDFAAGVEGAGDEIFAGAGRSLDKGGAVVWCDAADAGEHFGHARAGADDAFEFGVGAQLLALTGVIDEAAEALAQDREADRFLEVVGGTVSDGQDSGFCGVVRGHEDDVGGGGDLHDAGEDVEAGHFGHDEIGKDEMGMMLLNEGERFAGARRGVDDDSFLGERCGEKLETAGIVVEDDDGNVHSTGYRVQGAGYREQPVAGRVEPVAKRDGIRAIASGGRLASGAEFVHPGGRVAGVCVGVFLYVAHARGDAAGVACERNTVEDFGVVSDGGWPDCGATGRDDRDV